jgi:hypothetical protein
MTASLDAEAALGVATIDLYQPDLQGCVVADDKTSMDRCYVTGRWMLLMGSVVKDEKADLVYACTIVSHMSKSCHHTHANRPSQKTLSIDATHAPSTNGVYYDCRLSLVRTQNCLRADLLPHAHRSQSDETSSDAGPCELTRPSRQNY